MKLDTRSIRVDTDGIYLGEAEIRKGSSLCDFCSIQTICSIKPKRQLRRCDIYVPALSFSPSALGGLDGKFSTFRSSYVWAARAHTVMKSHKKIGLFCTDGRFIGLGKVLKVSIGTTRTMLQAHSHTNHLVIASGISKQDAPEWLKRQIANVVGTRYVSDETRAATVIFIDGTQKG